MHRTLKQNFLLTFNYVGYSLDWWYLQRGTYDCSSGRYVGVRAAMSAVVENVPLDISIA
jgi:hypothetical protein